MGPITASHQLRRGVPLLHRGERVARGGYLAFQLASSKTSFSTGRQLLA